MKKGRFDKHKQEDAQEKFSVPCLCLQEEIQTEKALNEVWEFEKVLRAFGRRVVVNIAIILMYVVAGVCIYFATKASVEAVEDRRVSDFIGLQLVGSAKEGFEVNI